MKLSYFILIYLYNYIYCVSPSQEGNASLIFFFRDNYKDIPLYYNELGIIGMIGKALFCTIRWCPYFNMTKMALNSFCDETLIYSLYSYICIYLLCLTFARRKCIVDFLFLETIHSNCHIAFQNISHRALE